MRQEELGNTLVDVVLAISVGMVAAAALIAYSGGVGERAKVNDLARQVPVVLQAAANRYSYTTGYSGLTNASLVASMPGAFPKEMVTGTSGNERLVNPFGDQFTISSSDSAACGAGGCNDLVEVSFPATREQCMFIARLDYGESHIETRIGGASFSKPWSSSTLSSMATSCRAAASTTVTIVSR